MLLYYGIFLALALGAFVELYGLKKKDRLKLYLVFCMGLYVMSWIRWETGTDWLSYVNFFNATSEELFPESEFEVGYTLLNSLVKLFGGDYTLVLVFCATILFGCQSPAIWKLSPYPIFSLLFWFGINYAGVFFVRQMVAGAILFYSVIYIRDRRFWPFALCVFMAMLLHRSSAIFLLAYWVYKWQIHPYLMVIFVFVSIAFAGVADYVMQSLGSLVGGAIQMKIDAYTGELQGDTFGLSQSMPVIIAKAFFSKLLLVAVALFMLKPISKESPEFRGYLNLYWFGVIIYLMTITISPGLSRMAYGFDMMQIVVLAYILRAIPNRDIRLFAIVISFCYIALRLYTVTTGGYYDMYVPYKTILE